MKSSPEFIDALFALTRERGGGYIPRHEIEERARQMKPRPLPLPLPGSFMGIPMKVAPLPLPGAVASITQDGKEIVALALPPLPLPLPPL